MTASAWPQRAAGGNKTFGEMTKRERDAQVEAAVLRFRGELPTIGAEAPQPRGRRQKTA